MNRFILEHKLQREQLEASLADKEQSLAQTVINKLFSLII
jgi:hypothetical protein